MLTFEMCPVYYIVLLPYAYNNGGDHIASDVPNIRQILIYEIVV